jgi:DNA primase
MTKVQLIDYYLRISDYLLLHLKNRPVTLKRYPNGALGEFYEKDAPSFTLAWVQNFSRSPTRIGRDDSIRSSMTEQHWDG